MKVLVLADIDKRVEKDFPELDFVYKGYALEDHIPLTAAELKDAVVGVDILISEFDTVNKEIIDAASDLKMIICCRGGVHTVVDVPYATKKGIMVRNTPARNATAVTEYVMGVIFNNDRKLVKANELVLSDTLQNQEFVLPEQYRDSLWGMDKNSPYHTLRGKGLRNITLGVIGYGNVGRIVVNTAVLLGMHVIVYDRFPIVSPIPSGVEVVDLDTLLARADYVSLHCSNRNHEAIIREEEFRKMKEGAYFINTARGDLVDEVALIDALNSGHLSGAALDVTSKEPLPPGSPLIAANNIFLTPHIAGAADEVIEIGTDMVIYYLREYLSDMWEEE